MVFSPQSSKRTKRKREYGGIKRMVIKNPLYPLSVSSLNSVVKKDLRNNAIKI